MLFDEAPGRLPGHEGFERVILYAPTYRDTGELPPILLDSEARRRLLAFLEERNLLLLLKPHRLDREAYAALGLRSAHVENLVDSNFDVVELFTRVDVLISDYSSIVFDYCLTRKPIVFFPYDLDDYRLTSRQMYYDYLELIPGPVARNEAELLECLADARPIDADPAYRARYLEFLGRFHEHQDGHSRRRVLAALGLPITPETR